MWQKTCKTICKRCAPWGLTALRVVLGAILINHGYGKLFGDTSGMLAFFESTVLPAPGFMLMLAGIIEFFGGILLVAGLFTRVVASIVIVQFVVIVLFVKLQMGFSKMELDLIILASAFALSCLGAGAAGIDEFVHKKKGTGERGGHGQEAIGG